MKKLLWFLLVLATLGAFSGCDRQTAPKKAVPTPLTWADIDAIPVATEDMTEEQLRRCRPAHCVHSFEEFQGWALPRFRATQSTEVL